MISFNKLIKVYEEIKMQTELLSYRDIKENAKVMKLLFLAIIAITEVLGNQNKEETIMKIRLNIEKKKGELLKKTQQ